MDLPELRKVRNSVSSHFNGAQRLYEQLKHDGNSERSMKGFCHHTKAGAGHAGMTLIGLPFVQLKEHKHHTEAERNSVAIINRLLGHSRYNQTGKDETVSCPDTVHATRTLFQYLNPRDNSRRDLKQVICHMLGPHDKRYLCVTQIWMFVVNEGEFYFVAHEGDLEVTDPDKRIELIITSSTLSEPDLCGDLLLPLKTHATPPKQGLVNVHVVSEDGHQWLLKAADCLSYIVSEYH